MISLYPEPPRASARDWPGLPGPNVLVMGMLLTSTKASTPVLSAVCCCEDGTIMVIPLGNLTIDYRYDVQTDTWFDLRREEPPAP